MARAEPGAEGPPLGVVFDLFGTLVEGWGEATAAARADELAAILGAPRVEFRRALEESYDQRARGLYGGPEEMLSRLARQAGVEVGEVRIRQAAQRRVAQFREELRRPRPEVASLLAVLRDRSIGVAVLTDCSGETPIVWGELGWAAPVQAVVFSFVEGARKPDPGLYSKAARLLVLPASRCLFVGDGGSQELSGARRAGMAACQLLSTRSDGDRLLQYDPDPGWQGAVVHSLSGILPLLRS